MTFYKHITTTLLIIIFIAMAPGVALGFSDTRAHWARPQIDHLKSRELLSGYPDGTYRPDAFVSREEFVTLVIKALNKESEARQLEKGQGFFSDTHQRWSRGFVDLAQELDITVVMVWAISPSAHRNPPRSGDPAGQCSSQRRRAYRRWRDLIY